MNAVIQAIDYYLPERVLDNAALAAEFPDWPAEKIRAKTGIAERRIAAADECASDLAVKAAERLLTRLPAMRPRIDFVLLCTQSPDYFLPTTACILQHRLGLATTCGALDFNLGCSGYVYGLSLAKGLIESGQASTVLLLTGETYSKYLHPRDKAVRTVFGDAGAATLIGASESQEPNLGPFVFGTDGSGAANLMVKTGAARYPRIPNAPVVEDASGNGRTENDLYMNGPEIFSFTLKAVPAAVQALLAKAGVDQDAVDLWVFHQANQYMLDHLRKKIGIPVERFVVALQDCGNTVSCTIPIALRDLETSGRLTKGAYLGLVGFGVGYSWGATLVRWQGAVD
jgi:3-oxoacyl-[acyl-carrier-protein] synthase-3